MPNRLDPTDSPLPRPILVVGIGNDYRGDDGAGLQVARRIRRTGLEDITVRESGGDLTSLPDSWSGFGSVFLIDVVQSGSPAGTLLRFDASAESLPAVFVCHVSSHGISLADAVELARALQELPEHLIVYGIEGKTFDMGADLSPEVVRAVGEAAGRILGEISREA